LVTRVCHTLHSWALRAQLKVDGSVSTNADMQFGYTSYLLRLWPVTSAGAVVWRASLESTRTAEQRRFANLEQLVAFLHEHTTAAVVQTIVSTPCMPFADAGEQPTPQSWRFSLKNERDGEHHDFASLESLLAFLKANGYEIS
jgi:hypothetical protein